MTIPTIPEPASSPDGSLTARVASRIDGWKRRLLDLSKRNRALNFRVSKVATITVVDELPAEVFRQLYLLDLGMSFAPSVAADAPQVPLALEPGTGPTADADDAVLTGPEFTPYDPASVADRHRDAYLQTAATADQLHKSLRLLDDLSRTAVEEQGVNTLFLALGMLEYTEAADSQQVLRAPLILLPVTLHRKSAATGYTVHSTDEDPIVNPALAESLRRQFGVALPELPDMASADEHYDLNTLFGALKTAIGERANWSIKTEIYLAQFSFQKLVMYKDLDANAAAMQAHRLIRSLVSRTGDAHVVGLPPDIRDLVLDDAFPPENCSHVVDADSSQLRALAAVARRHDLVIEGPPGTGKSQTITNLIAQTLAEGKSVLFVAEKMAALQVVYDRLVDAGLAEFCLELHSTKANKRAVMHSLGQALDASFGAALRATASATDLPNARAVLSLYVQTVHAPFGTLGISPFSAYGRLGQVLGAPRMTLARAVDDVTMAQLEQTTRELKDLAATAGALGEPGQHPWRDAVKTFYSENELETVRDIGGAVGKELEQLMACAKDVELRFRLRPLGTFAEVDTAIAFAALLERCPGVPLSVLGSDTWNGPPADAVALVERGRELDRLKERVHTRFTPAVLEQDHGDDIAFVEAKAQGPLGFLAVLNGRWRAIRRRWRAYRLPSYSLSMIEQAVAMKQVDKYAREHRAFGSLSAQAQNMFGVLWEGERSDWNGLEAYIGWVVEFRGACVRAGMSSEAFEVATRPKPDVSIVEPLRARAKKAADLLRDLRLAIGWPAGYLSESLLDEIAARVGGVVRHVSDAPRWAAFEGSRSQAANGMASEALAPAFAGDLHFASLPEAFLRAFYSKWVEAVVRERPPLALFNTMLHGQRIDEFRRLDRQVLEENKTKLKNRLRNEVQQRLRDPTVAAAMGNLRPELAKQRRHRPLRTTMRTAAPAIRAIKPCFLMSPLSVAQYLGAAASDFDLVVFDEASQLPSEDAVGAIMRGKQLVVVGDPKQLPPTNFFAVAAGLATASLDDDGEPIYEDAESVLEDFMGSGVPMSRLKWHYRSAHESLIHFSNVSFYDAELYTFPSVEPVGETLGLHFEYVPLGVYEGKGLNIVEARRVVDAVVAFAKEQLSQAEGMRRSLGVGTFNQRQQKAIEDLLYERRRLEPAIEPFFAKVGEAFFVKNLENIQGDERDVIFLSVTYAKAADGRLRYNFGPLNGENGWRRLNVIATRARRLMRVFSSMQASDINPGAVVSQGPTLLRDFLHYAETGQLDGLRVTAGANADSPFEMDVTQELRNRGYRPVPQVGVSGYRIDIGIQHPDKDGWFICGIECDGATYHSSESARDRDRLRQEVLENRGWTIHRLWSTDWFKDRRGQIERLVHLIEASKQRAATAVAAEDPPAVNVPVAATAAGATTPSEEPPYARPAAEAYRKAGGEGRYGGQEILAAPDAKLFEAILGVIEVEAPIHEANLASRVAAMWDNKAGSKIRARILQTCRKLENMQRLVRKGEFLWSPSKEVKLRSRSGSVPHADRIAPEEYRLAVIAVLGAGHAFPREELINEVRAVLGFGRTGATLDKAIGGAVDALVASGELGEGSTGLRLRTGSVSPA